MTSRANFAKRTSGGNAPDEIRRLRRRIARLETRLGFDASIANLEDGVTHGEDGITIVAGPYPDTAIQQWITDDTGEKVARALGYYLSDGTFSGFELDAIAKAGGSIGDLVLAVFDSTDDVDVDPARAAIHIRSDGSIIVGGRISVEGFVNLDRETLTIAAGIITATRSLIYVDTQGGAATDDLDTINGGLEGDLLIVRAFDNTHDVVMKDGTGNLRLAGDFTMDTASDTMTLVRGSTFWLELTRSNNA